MTPWEWWAGDLDDDCYSLANEPMREAVVREAMRGMKPGDRFRIVEARSSSDKRYEGSDFVPFMRTRNHEIITAGPISAYPSPVEIVVGSTRLRNIETAAAYYVATVNGGPMPDIWDTESGKYEDGAQMSISDFAWKSYDDRKQEAFEALRAALSASAAEGVE